eukprot:TRINITY_DN68483_c0_g1_i1.p1 TRINITY_DN68483_c0_g1~~TRINITY_DN68483_c0_g1_i1.p1  ORF type:complete len:345 (+),score=60.06 TRINITY_DN68483_c0_g1_i1:61-1095(+)
MEGEEDTFSEYSESPPEHFLNFPPAGAWDFPLSRAEKVQRLFQLFEAELDVRTQHHQAAEEEEEDEREKAQDSDGRLVEGPSACEKQHLFPAKSSAVPAAAITLVSDPSDRSIREQGMSRHGSSRGSFLESSPCSLRAPATPSKASSCFPASFVKAVEWNGGSDVVRWLRLIPTETSHSHTAEGRDRPSCRGKRVTLLEGEHIKAVRGRIAVPETGHLADWLMLVTSNLRCITLGQYEKGSSPTFSFVAASGYEIHDILPGASGSVSGVEQRRVPTSSGCMPTQRSTANEPVTVQGSSTACSKAPLMQDSLGQVRQPARPMTPSSRSLQLHSLLSSGRLRGFGA